MSGSQRLASTTPDRASEGAEYFGQTRIKEDLRQSAIRGAGATLFAQLSNYCLQMAGTVILARLLSPPDFGLVALVTYVFLFFKMLRNMGLIDATIQRERVSSEQISALFWINALFGLVLFLLFAAIGPLLASFYHEPKLVAISVWMGLVFVFGGISTQHIALMKRRMQYYRSTANEMVATVAGVTTAVWMALKGFGYWSLVAKHVSFELTIMLGAWLLCSWRPALPRLGTDIGVMLKFGLNMLGNLSVNYLAQNVDKIMLGKRYGTEAMGNYDKAYQLFLAPAQQLSYPMTHLATATLSRLCDEPEKYRRYYLQSISMLAFIGFPMSAMLAVMGRDIILLLLGPQWQLAGGMFSVFALGIGVQILYGTNAWLHLSLGRADRWLRWSLAATVVTIVLFVVGLPFGPLGLATAYTAAMYLLLGPGIAYAGRPIDLRFSSVASRIWRFYVAGCIAGFCAWIVTSQTSGYLARTGEWGLVSRLAVSSALVVVFYCAGVAALHRSFRPMIECLDMLRTMVPRFSRARPV